MNTIILFLRQVSLSMAKVVRLRQILTVFLAGVTFFVGAAFSSNLQAQAASMTPEATQYQVDSSAAGASNQYQAKPKSDLGDALDNVREKLNLDEPVYEGTKVFGEQVKEKVRETLDGTKRTVEDATS
jgi:hypothetical protein